MKKAVGYIRVSTSGQANEDRYGKEAQKRDIENYCKKNEIEIVHWYVDVISGVKDERPEFNKILFGEKNPPTECVVIAKSDRLARDVNVYFYYKMILKKNNIELISIAEDFGQFGVFAPMLESFIICVADMERRNINMRTSTGREVKASKGGYSGGRTPYGYDTYNGKLIINEKQAEAVRIIFKMRDSGKTMREITDKLNELGYVNNSGTKFQHSTVETIIRNRKKYEGYYKYGKNGKWVKGEHEAILNNPSLD